MKLWLKSILLLSTTAVLAVASAQTKNIRNTPLTIEGKKEKSAIETMTLPPVLLDEEISAPLVRPRFEDAASLLDDPEALLGISNEGLPVSLDSK